MNFCQIEEHARREELRHKFEDHGLRLLINRGQYEVKTNKSPVELLYGSYIFTHVAAWLKGYGTGRDRFVDRNESGTE